MERLTERDGKQVLYRKDGESYPFPLMSQYDIQRVLERLAYYEDKAEPVAPDIETYHNMDYPRCPNCGRTFWKNDFYCGTCGLVIKRSDVDGK